MKPKTIKFKEPYPGACPAYGDYYIRDRCSGRDVHGHLSYEYSLFRRLPFVVKYQFSDETDARDFFAKLVLRSRVPVNDNGNLVALVNNTIFKLDLKTLEISEKPLENEQLSGWHDRLSDCIADAKEIIAKREEKK